MIASIDGCGVAVSRGIVTLCSTDRIRVAMNIDKLDVIAESPNNSNFFRASDGLNMPLEDT